MSYETFSTSQNPLAPMGNEATARTLSSGLGDGYSQETGDGLNAVSGTLTPSWRLPIAEVDEKIAFLKARGGFEPFWWTPPRESSPRLFKCKKWSRGYVTHLLDSLTATFTEAFDL